MKKKEKKKEKVPTQHYETMALQSCRSFCVGTGAMGLPTLKGDLFPQGDSLGENLIFYLQVVISCRLGMVCLFQL